MRQSAKILHLRGKPLKISGPNLPNKAAESWCFHPVKRLWNGKLFRVTYEAVLKRNLDRLRYVTPLNSMVDFLASNPTIRYSSELNREATGKLQSIHPSPILMASC